MSLLSDAKGKMEYSNFGEISFTDALMGAGFFAAVGSIFSGFDITVPTGEESEIILSDVWFTMMDIDVSYALAVALGFLAVQLVQSAQAVGRSDDIDVQDYVDRLPTGVTILLVVAVVSLTSALLEGRFGIANDVYTMYTETYVRELATVVANTGAYMAISREN